MLAKLFCVIGFFCTHTLPAAFPISGNDVARSAQDKFFEPLIFEWNTVCPLDQTRSVTALWQNDAAVLNEMQSKISGFVHGMTPNWKVREQTTLRVPPRPCTYILGDGIITLPQISFASTHKD